MALLRTMTAMLVLCLNLRSLRIPGCHCYRQQQQHLPHQLLLIPQPQHQPLKNIIHHHLQHWLLHLFKMTSLNPMSIQTWEQHLRKRRNGNKAHIRFVSSNTPTKHSRSYPTTPVRYVTHTHLKNKPTLTADAQSFSWKWLLVKEAHRKRCHYTKFTSQLRYLHG